MRCPTTTQVLFGTDYPFRRAAPTLEQLASYPLSVADRAAIDRGNALALFPRFARG